MGRNTLPLFRSFRESVMVFSEFLTGSIRQEAWKIQGMYISIGDSVKMLLPECHTSSFTVAVEINNMNN